MGGGWLGVGRVCRFRGGFGHAVGYLRKHPHALCRVHVDQHRWLVVVRVGVVWGWGLFSLVCEPDVPARRCVGWGLGVVVV